MDNPEVYLFAADAILILHVLFVAFVAIGLILVLIGKTSGWSWVRNPWLRLAHVAAIGVVTIQSWLGMLCPLTTWENTLRTYAGDSTYPGSFISYFLESILYYRAPAWAFIVGYTIFGIIVVASWVWVRPRPFTKPQNNDAI